MDSALLFKAFLMGVVEAGTEFLPVSSTGHLLLLGHLIDFETSGRVFEVAIQLGAILAVMVLYFWKLWGVLLDLPKAGQRGEQARKFAAVVLAAFVPAMAIGYFAHGFIKNVLFNPWVVCVSLIVGGLIIFWVEQVKPKPRVHAVEDMSLGLALKIGFIQCLAMIPGVSRSGATIMGSLMLGVNRVAATEFSFFLAIPTMVAAVAYDMFVNRENLDGDDFSLIAVGFVTTFVVALVVVRWLVGFVSRHGFTPFAWWRIMVGSLGLLMLAAGV